MHKKLILVGACLVSSTLVGCGEAKVEWNCEGTGPSSLQCEVKNSGTASGEACFDIALVCVASRTIIWSLIEQLRVSLMPLFHGLHRCFAVQC